MASSSLASSAHLGKHDVFLSFRGADTRNNFVSYLHRELTIRSGIETYIDYRLDGGEVIEPTLLEKIQESLISVVIFSKNYANSSFCLRELTKILECKEAKDQIVIPVFYQVDPSDVQELSGSYKDGLAALEGQCSSEEMDGWKRALVEIASLKGWDSNVTKPDTLLVNNIVADIQKKLHHMPSLVSSPSDSRYLVGIDSRICEVKSLLCFESSDVMVVGIWGMGGMGKTTIAEAVYSRNSPLFDGSSFFRNVREESDKHGVLHVRNEIIHQVLEKPDLVISMTELEQDTKRMLKRRRILIVLDDVSSSQQLEAALGEDDFLFGEGSKIIVTSRDRKLLENRCCKTYNVQELCHVEASQLFKLYAFKGNECPEGFKELSERAVSYTEGHPLSLKILGSSLYNKSLKEWEAVFANLKGSLDPEIQKILMMSYNGLDWKQKRIFLDIACFFKRCNRDLVQDTLDQCGFDAKNGIDRLIDMGLVDVSENNEIWMHDLLQQLGQDIVQQENFDDPRKRSRLWIADDIDHVLTHHKGTETIQSISLNSDEIDPINLSPTVFEEMYNLRLLELYSFSKSNLLFPAGLKFLPKKLRVLRWDWCPLRSLPSNFIPKHLVEIRLRTAQLFKLWDNAVPLLNLKWLEVSGAYNLSTISPAFLSSAPKLEVLNLSACSLVEIPSSIGKCNKLTTLDLSGCTKLASLPDDIQQLHCLVELNLGNCQSLKSLPSNIGWLKCLTKLDLPFCSELISLPDSIGLLVSLTELGLSCTRIRSIPASIKQLTNLTKLDLSCTEVQFLPELPSSLQYIDSRSCMYLKSIQNIFTQDDNRDYEAASEHVNFSMCPSLDETSRIKVLGCAQSRVQSMAESLFKQEYRSAEPITFTLSIHGGRVPEWFIYKNKGSSLEKIKPPTHTKGEFLGFAFCAVLVFDAVADRMSDLTCKCRLITKDGPRDLHISYNQRYIDPCLDTLEEHAFIWYEWSSRIYYSGHFFNEASFDFYPQFVGNAGGSEWINEHVMIECGVHLLFAQDDEMTTLIPI